MQKASSYDNKVSWNPEENIKIVFDPFALVHAVHSNRHDLADCSFSDPEGEKVEQCLG